MSERSVRSIYQAYEKAGFGFEQGMAAWHQSGPGWQNVPFAPSLRIPGLDPESGSNAVAPRVDILPESTAPSHPKKGWRFWQRTPR